MVRRRTEPKGGQATPRPPCFASRNRAPRSCLTRGSLARRWRRQAEPARKLSSRPPLRGSTAPPPPNERLGREEGAGWPDALFRGASGANRLKLRRDDCGCCGAATDSTAGGPTALLESNLSNSRCDGAGASLASDWSRSRRSSSRRASRASRSRVVRVALRRSIDHR